MLRGRTVLVTGADGFIGSHLVETLVRSGCNVRAFVYYNSWNSCGWLSDTDPELLAKVTLIFGNICDTERVYQAVEGCDYVFHLSSLIGIPYSYHAPRSYVDTNITGALNVLEACRRSKTLIRMVNTSTSEVYGTAQTVPITETHPLVGQSPYSATKIGADKLAESFFLSFGLPVVTARPFNTFGPRQTARAVIPTIASQLLLGIKELKLGALTPTRDFNYVQDTVEGLIALSLCKAAEGEVVNIGTGKEWSIEATANMLMEITGFKAQIICDEQRIRPANSEVNRLIADNSKLCNLTDWTPSIDFCVGLQRTCAWIKRNPTYFHAEQYLL